jgi:hypothetical protein
MNPRPTPREVAPWWTTGTAAAATIAVATIAVHLATGNRYGFDRDELMALEDARHLAWGYVQYPPMTPFFGWLALKLFGTSLVGFRFFAALVQAVALLLTAQMARHLGGGKWAQITATLAGVPFCLGGGALMQYISFDYICWVLLAYAAVRLLTSGNQRWWLAIGTAAGLGMEAKYTIGLLVAGLIAGVVAAGLQLALRHEGTRAFPQAKWILTSAALAAAIFLPNFFWQWRHHFISLDFLRFVHQRDVQTGVTNNFFLGQLELTMFALPIAVAGLYFYFVNERYRLLAWMYVVPLVILVVVRGRDYYLAPAYPLLYAAGAVWFETKIAKRELPAEAVAHPSTSRISTFVFRFSLFKYAAWLFLALNIAAASAVALPLAPVNSTWWKLASQRDIVFPEEIGWQEFTQCVAQVWQQLPSEEKPHAAILAGNYGELGALNLYGSQFGLPLAISGVNSSWERGYGNPAPETLIVVGYPKQFLDRHFTSCEVRGHVWNSYGVANEETTENSEIFACHGLHTPWPEFWQAARKFA